MSTTKKPALRTGKTAGNLLLLALGLLLTSCSGNGNTIRLGISDGQLASCPDSPNCVSSTAIDDDHLIGPFVLQAPVQQAWEEVKKSITALPRTQIINQTSDYLHAECRSAVFGFIDDLELQLRLEERTIEVRSAARVGYYDFGVNRKRVNELREKLQAAEAIR
jgi:uncharacterized protein (DUF1499 family)